MRSNQKPVNSNSINKTTRLSLESDDTNLSKSQKRKKEKRKKRNTFKRPALSKPDKDTIRKKSLSQYF